MRKRPLSLLAIALLASVGLAAPLTHAEDFAPLVTIKGLNDAPNLTSSSGIGLFLNNLYEFSIGIAVVLAIAMIIWGGTEYALSEAITSKGAGKKKVQQALYGLLLVLSPALVFSIINPEILKLNVNFPKLETAWGTYAEGGYTIGEPNSESGCTGSDCTAQATACNNVPNQTAVYQCIAPGSTCGDASPHIVKSDTTAITCASGQSYCVACVQNVGSPGG